MVENGSEFPRQPHGSPGILPPPKPGEAMPIRQSIRGLLVHLKPSHLPIPIATACSIAVAIFVGIVFHSFWIPILLLLFAFALALIIFLLVLREEGSYGKGQTVPVAETKEEKKAEKGESPPAPTPTREGRGWGRSLLIFLIAVVLVVIVVWGINYWCLNQSAAAPAPKMARKTTLNFNPNLVCKNAFRHEFHYENFRGDSFPITLPEECWSGTIYLPERWSSWSFQGGETASRACWVAFWYAGMPLMGPRSCDDNLSARGWQVNKQVRVQGNNQNLVFYRTDLHR